jgi:hypothetical protein
MLPLRAVAQRFRDRSSTQRPVIVFPCTVAEMTPLLSLQRPVTALPLWVRTRSPQVRSVERQVPLMAAAGGGVAGAGAPSPR